MASRVDKAVLIKNFSRHAGSYDDDTRAQDKSARILLNKLPEDNITRILEIGCGTGNYTLLLKERFKEAQIRAVDISDAMVKVAKRKLDDGKTDFVIGDAETMELGCAYDLITSNAAFQWLVDLEAIIRRSASALSASGTLHFSSFGPSTFSELKESLSSVTGRNVSITPDSFPGKPKIEAILERYFKKVNVTEERLVERYPSLSEFLKKIKYSGTRGSGADIRKVWSPDLVNKIEKIYLERFGAITATYQAFFCEGRVKR